MRLPCGGIDAYFSASGVKPPHGLSIDETMAALNRQIAKLIAWHQVSHRWEYFMYVHFAEPDETGHRFGRDSPEWDADVVRLDTILGELRDRLNPEAVFVYSDHGFHPKLKSHYHAPAAFFASNFPLQTNGNRWDVVPTICTVLELPWRTYRPWLLGRSLLVQ